MIKLLVLILTILTFSATTAAQDRGWVIQLEEPTGIERRDNEIVRILTRFAAGETISRDLRILNEKNLELPIQVIVRESHPDGSIKAAELLFPATLIPGQLPRYRLLSSSSASDKRQLHEGGGNYLTDLIARRLGTSRVELGNSRFGVIINLGNDNTTPAIVEAYNRASGEHRMLNLVETTPDVKEDLRFGVRSAGWGTAVTNVPDATRLSGFTKVEIIESGPLRARVRLGAARFGANAETWEFEYYAGSPVLVWRTRIESKTGSYGFFFSSVSAFPYEPFTHWAGGAEVSWPDGDTNNPPHKKILPQNFLVRAPDLADLPGGHVLYYNPLYDYGALDFIELDTTLKWLGVGSRQFYATRDLGAGPPQVQQVGISAIKRPDILEQISDWSSQIAIAFPKWNGNETLLDARACYRKFAQPIVGHILEAQSLRTLPAFTPAQKTTRYEIETTKAVRQVGNEPAVGVTLSLDGLWKIRSAEKGEGAKEGLFQIEADDSSWQSVPVPGSVHTQILKYPVYYSHEAEWISFKEWWYRKHFQVPAGMKGKLLRLQFGATDYYADIWLNGKPLGRHEGYIDPYEFEITDRVKLEQDNVIVVRVWTPVDYYWRHRPYTIKGSYGAVDQKPDDITAVGITRSVRLVANDSIIIDDVVTRPLINPDGSADLEVEVTLSTNVMTGTLKLTLEPRNFSGGEQYEAKVDLSRLADQSERHVQVRFHLDKPQLWWTWDHGSPNLYTLFTRVLVNDNLSDSRSQAVGIREIEKVGWVFYLNGRRTYIRGTNSYYLELFMSEMNREKYVRDLKLMKSMNINMIRLHCHFQNPEFYDLCDELGILVWQDFLEAWYPHDTEFALKASRLYDGHIRMVRNHPSIAIWATSDEEDLENYRVMTKHLAGRLFVWDQEHRPVVRSTGRFGDGHIYYGWYGGNIWQYTTTEEKFISELGATALPNYETLMKFLPNHWPIAEHKDEWIFRKLQIGEAMRAWGSPDGKSLKEYIPQTQAYVARLHQLAIERMRRRKYEAGGILHFHAIDFWPSVTMAALDYFRQPTKSYFVVQRSFQMVLASLEYDRDVWKVGEDFRCGLWLINDHWFSLPRARVVWKIVDSAGTLATGGELSVKITEDSSVKLDELRWKTAKSGHYELRAAVIDGSGKTLSENIYEFDVK
ncbi:MAG TPA: glycoside hydrolase family 2 TIM barrel-domain containing protein [Blastocatellia bacterium]|nr:glycoside hydrolase family 2 TIM barrel-domain containing protein [Blastocatellia bacterium]